MFTFKSSLCSYFIVTCILYLKKKIALIFIQSGSVFPINEHVMFKSAVYLAVIAGAGVLLASVAGVAGFFLAYDQGCKIS